MTFKIKIKIVLLVMVFAPIQLMAQNSKTALEKKQAGILKEIDKTNKQLQETAKRKDLAVERIDKLNGKIELRKELINTIQSEVSVLDTQIISNLSKIGKLTTKLNNLKADYSRMVFFAYKNRGSTDQLLYILGSDDANKAFSRAQYFKRISSSRRMLAGDIKKNQESLIQVNNDLVQNKNQKANALAKEAKQKEILESERIEQEQMALKLKSKEKELRAKLVKKEKERIDLEAKIRKIIEAEILAEKKRAEIAAKKEEEKRKKAAELAAKNAAKNNEKPNNTDKKEPVKEKPISLTVSPETQLISESFEQNRGRLPWPVEKGRISSGFGTKPHPYLKNVTVKNDGIDITTNPGADARAVFKGKVSGVFTVQGYGKVIIIRHGEYLTVYSNLGDVFVQKDSEVNVKQRLGKIESGEKGEAVINFQVRKGSTTLNPQSWISAM